jgi:effector-binding domain-containing protein
VDRQFTLVQVKSTPIAVVRLRTTFAMWASQWGTALGAVYQVVKAGKVEQQGQNVMVYRPLGGDRVDVECGVQIAKGVKDIGEVVCSETPSGTAATVVHMGPYDQLGESHKAVEAWCHRHGHRLAGVCWEVYGDWEDDPARRRADIFHVVKI